MRCRKAAKGEEELKMVERFMHGEMVTSIHSLRNIPVVTAKLAPTESAYTCEGSLL